MVWGGGMVFALGAAGIALIPDGAWILFSLLRFVVGFGSMAATTAQNPLIVEITPTRYRTFVSSMMVVPVALGTMFAAMVSASLLPVIGWRGVAFTGAAPIVTSLLILLIVPESVRWLLSRGRNADARREAAKLLGVAREQHHVAVSGAAHEEGRLDHRAVGRSEAVLVGGRDLGRNLHRHLWRAAMGPDHPVAASQDHTARGGAVTSSTSASSRCSAA